MKSKRSPKEKPKKIKKVGIVGTGTMGATVAKIFSEKGFKTILWGRSPASIERARGIIGDEALKLMSTTNDLKDLADCDFINESIAEDIETKRDFYTKISEIVRPDTILTTNTSGLSMNSIAVSVKGKERFLGMHWFNPSNLIPLIEIIYCDETSEENGKAVYQLSLDLGKKPVFCRKDVPGFIANRIQFAILRESLDIVEKGVASKEDVDSVMKYGLGFRLAAYGPLEVADFGGLDTFYHISEYLNKDLCDKKEPMQLMKDCFEKGKFGVKSGEGFYEYPGNKAKEVVEIRNKKYEDMKALNQKRRKRKNKNI
ncbi:MAG: 3-hydroxyacyl-CoA dehydrogenase NAD-binding domain-containing protein [archaeon]|nr:3-hydroxyacyl-CoA dehydrogenase NAD-binding domain-containing protein [archaeon]